MPELIEVFLTASYLNKVTQGQTIKSIKIDKQKYHKKLSHSIKKLVDDEPKIVKVESKGKFMWFELDNDMFLICRFGLGGYWTKIKSINNHVSIKLGGCVNDENCCIHFNNIGFGLFDIANEEELEKEIDKLGDDFLHVEINDDVMYERIHKYVFPKSDKTPPKTSNIRKQHKIVKVLMNQNKNSGLGSGIGNYLVAEILYKASMSPHTTIGFMLENKNSIHSLCKAIKYTIKNTLYNYNIEYFKGIDDEFVEHIDKLRKNKNRYYKDTKIPKSFEFNVYGKEFDKKGNKVIVEEINGKRKTYWSPSVQK